MELFTDIIDAFTAQKHFRFVVFGASNTERYMPVVHWVDVLEVCLRGRFGRKFQMVNSGVSGNNYPRGIGSLRYGCGFFQACMRGDYLWGNDCNPTPEKNVPYEEFEANMVDIVRRVRALDAIPVLQTYYAMDYSEMDSRRAEAFKKNMDIVRLVAQNENVHLVDQNALFSKAGNIVLRHKLLLNAMHVNQLGNMLIGVELAMHFDCHPESIVENDTLLPAIALHKKLQE